MHKLVSIVMTGLLFITVIATLTGCEQLVENVAKPSVNNTPSPQPGAVSQTLDEYFDGKTFYFYRQAESSLTCESGSCPDSTEIPAYLQDEECFFSDGSEVYDDRMVVHISPSSTSDSSGGCIKKSDFTWPQELTITEKSEDMIITTGAGGGRVEQTGSNCDNYVYTFETQETWIFSNQKLEDLVTMDAFTGAPQSVLTTVTTYIIDAPGWDNPPKTMEYSHFGITITPVSDYDFRFLPEARLIRIEGHRLNTSVLKIDTTEKLEGAVQFNFAASFNADYVIVPVLKVIGKNGKVLREIVSTSEYIIRVTNSPQGDLPN